METDERYADWLAGCQALLDASDETQEAFGKKVGKSREHINSILNNRKRAGEDLQDAISRALGMNYDDVRLYGREKLGKPLRVIARQTAHLIFGPAEGPPVAAPPAHQIPLLGRVPAGDPRQITDADILGWESVGSDIPGNAYALRVSGNSMRRPDDSNSISDGDTVIFIEKSDPAHNDMVVVCDEFGDVMLKRLKIRPDGEYVLASDNPAYEPIRPNGAYRIIGVVIDAHRKISVR